MEWSPSPTATETLDDDDNFGTKARAHNFECTAVIKTSKVSSIKSSKMRYLIALKCLVYKREREIPVLCTKQVSQAILNLRTCIMYSHHGYHFLHWFLLQKVEQDEGFTPVIQSSLHRFIERIPLFSPFLVFGKERQ